MITSSFLVVQFRVRASNTTKKRKRTSGGVAPPVDFGKDSRQPATSTGTWYSYCHRQQLRGSRQSFTSWSILRIDVARLKESTIIIWKDVTVLYCT